MVRQVIRVCRNVTNLIAFAAITVVAKFTMAEAPLPAKIGFNRDVRPILSNNCLYCHGPDANHREADLRLDNREAAIASGAINTIKPFESELLVRLTSTDPEVVMPPPSSHKSLTDREKTILRKWIEQGAEYQRHWSYEKPAKPVIPTGASAIDYLVRERLKAIGVPSSERADPRTLIRRLYADLIGLPPTPEVVERFVADDSRDAYRNVVEQLLASEHFGERMAIGWLDVVRYADTIGYHSDTPRNVWPYRDWVIKSFNDNKPFDRFTIEQVAGDLLPDANDDTRVGSAFNRLLLTTEEGGAQAKDYEQRMLTDRVRAIGTTWLGQTTGCAQCHDHKFDPITMRDFYSLGAFFADIQEPIIGKREEGMVLGTDDQRKKLEELDSRLAKAKSKFDEIKSQLDAAQLQWESDIVRYEIQLPELAKESKAEPAARELATRVTTAIKKAKAKRTKQEVQLIEGYFYKSGTNLFKDEREELNNAIAARNQLYEKLPKCLVSISASEKRIV